MERAWRVAKEISNLIIYCRSVTFNAEQVRQGNYIYNEMSSFPETKAEKLMCQQESKLFLRYHKVIKFQFIVGTYAVVIVRKLINVLIFYINDIMRCTFVVKRLCYLPLQYRFACLDLPTRTAYE